MPHVLFSVKFACGVFWLIAALLLAAIPANAASSNNMISFKAACTPGKRATVAVTGDLLFHRKLQVQAYQKGSSFQRFFAPVKHVLQAADITYGNLEGPAAKGVALGGRSVKDTGKRIGQVYGAPLGLLAFNYHPSVIPDLAASGFDILSTANNHSMDRSALGADRTIAALRKHAMPYTGTRARGEILRRWSVVTKAQDISVAWLACTYSTNGIPDRKKQVRHCYKEKAEILEEIRELRSDPAIDAIFLTPHWGVENHHRPAARARKLGREAIEAGANAVLGAHPHVLQPWEKVVTEEGREGLIIYSSGNFISNQRRTSQRAGILGLLELVKSVDGKTQLAAAGYMPTWVEIDGKGHRVTFNERSKGRRREALSRTLGLLPMGNRMKAATPFAFPVSCSGERYAALSSPEADSSWARNPYRSSVKSSRSKRKWKSSKRKWKKKRKYRTKKRKTRQYRKRKQARYRSKQRRQWRRSSRKFKRKGRRSRSKR